jgi:hypothetical protein
MGETNAERYVVRSVVGWRITNSRADRSPSHNPGVTAVVLDRLDAWREVGRFGSEDPHPVYPMRCRRALGALTAAETLADELNAAA